MLISILFLWVIGVSAIVVPLGKRAAPSVTIANGTVVGSNSYGIDYFLGIPFAKPPVGSLRLKPPAYITTGFGTIQATAIPRSCPQFPAAASNSGEDCLTLNVQRPAGATSTSKYPVVVWIYGGGFETGSTQTYNASAIIKRSISLGAPIIHVDMNYRLGGFGFLAGADLAAEGSTNLGLRDQRLALQWVQDNIAAFGGDPTKVTLWGESAGSFSVFDHTIINGGDNTYKGKAMFRGAIMSSGSAVSLDSVTGVKAQNIYNTVVKAAGCSTAANKLTCLRGLNYTTFLNAANSVPSISSYRSVDLSYLPRPDSSNTFFSVTPEVAVVNGNFAKVPIIIGDQEDEGTVFSTQQTNITNNAQLITYIASFFPTNPNATDTATQFVATYPDDGGVSGSPFRTGTANNIYPEYKRLAAILGDLFFTLSRRAYLYNVAYQLPSWSFLGSTLYGTSNLGTQHGTDVGYSYDGTGVPGQSIQTYYIAFINSLNPNALGTSSPLINWPQWSSSAGTPQLLNFLASSNTLLNDDFRPSSYSFIVSHFSDLKI